MALHTKEQLGHKPTKESKEKRVRTRSWHKYVFDVRCPMRLLMVPVAKQMPVAYNPRRVTAARANAGGILKVPAREQTCLGLPGGYNSKIR